MDGKWTWIYHGDENACEVTVSIKVTWSWLAERMNSCWQQWNSSLRILCNDQRSQWILGQCLAGIRWWHVSILKEKSKGWQWAGDCKVGQTWLECRIPVSLVLCHKRKSFAAKKVPGQKIYTNWRETRVLGTLKKNF